MTGKTKFSTYENVRNTYEMFRARCVKTSPDKEDGCQIGFYGKQSKAYVQIIPLDRSIDETFKIDKDCIIRRINEK